MARGSRQPQLAEAVADGSLPVRALRDPAWGLLGSQPDVWRLRPRLTVPARGAELDFAALQHSFPELLALEHVPQDPSYHGEGDAGIHTRLVCQALIADPAYQRLDDDEREIMLLAAALHDIAKATTTVIDPISGRWSSPGHSRKGAQLARQMLWQMGLEANRREQVCALVAHHMRPPRLLEAEADQARRQALAISVTTRCDWLAMLSRADTNGRLAADTQLRLEEIELFEEYCAELGCLGAPYPFASDHARFAYFADPSRDPAYAAYDDTRSEVTLLCALPGSGKDHWLAREAPQLPVLSLDALRLANKVRRGDKRAEGQMRQQAREMMRSHLRAGESFAYNATNLSAQMRAPIIGLAADYHARVRIVCLECDPATLRARNAQRTGDARLPDDAYGELLSRWEAPDLTECHTLQRLVW